MEIISHCHTSFVIFAPIKNQVYKTIVYKTKTYNMKIITILFGLMVFTNVNAQINIQLPEIFNTYQIPDYIKGENIGAKASINYTNNPSHMAEFPKLKLEP